MRSDLQFSSGSTSPGVYACFRHLIKNLVAQLVTQTGLQLFNFNYRSTTLNFFARAQKGTNQSPSSVSLPLVSNLPPNPLKMSFSGGFSKNINTFLLVFLYSLFHLNQVLHLAFGNLTRLGNCNKFIHQSLGFFFPCFNPQLKFKMFMRRGPKWLLRVKIHVEIILECHL